MHRSYLLLISVLMLAGCSEVELSKLDIRNGVAYMKGTSDRFSGKVVAFYEKSGLDGKRRIHQQGGFHNGLKDGTWSTYLWNGDSSQTEYEEGVRVSTTWYDHRNTRRMLQVYKRGQPDGPPMVWDQNGKPNLNDQIARLY
ncbi:MAG: hypothetical protein HQL56_18125 [Magnetococcales bacterium]|nr:hypothetical protein [Magnetococcales bacterium]